MERFYSSRQKEFLTCYRKARQLAFTAKNIRSGWKSTGLWPVSIARPLLSPLLLENSTKASSQSVNPILDRALGFRVIQEWDIATVLGQKSGYTPLFQINHTKTIIIDTNYKL